MTEITSEIIEVKSEPGKQTINWPVIGIGASAGGLEALTSLVKGLEVGTDCTFVIIQHLSPHYRSMLVQLLGRDTTISVREIQDGEIPLRDAIYVAPAAYNVVLSEGKFRLLKPPQQVVPKPSIDLFMRSLADELGEMTVGIILSGTGSDGAAGVKAIKSGGGSVIVQDPDDAKYDGMPRAAIDTGIVDLIINAEDIPDHIQTLASIADLTGKKNDAETIQEQYLNELFARVKKAHGIDFRGYKETSIGRRIQRRMAVCRVTNLKDYLILLDKTPSEIEKLIREILISVTSFFRDHDAFEALKKAIDTIIDTKDDGEEFRVWVAGCATGEEAYSIAMLALEKAKTLDKNIRVQIYATDIDNNAIDIARRGVYPITCLNEIPVHYAQTYLIENTEECEISKPLRETVVFARQDLVQDPPFMRMDIISCRNVMIYFKSDLQAKILAIFYNSLLTDGYLFLGRSESVSQRQELFYPASSKWRLFQPSGGKHTNLSVAIAKDQIKHSQRKQDKKPKNQIEQIFAEAALSQYAPPSVIVNTQQEILHSWGDISDYIKFPSGQPKLSLYSFVRDEFKTDIQVLLSQVIKEKRPVRGRPKKLNGQKNRKPVRIVIYPTNQTFVDELFLVSFERVSKTKKEHAVAASDGITTLQIETELSATREQLQTLNQELETSNEEMQALTEELQASNEELQATNEELEASNEELQATNEELVTLNQEMLQKGSDMAALNAEFENVNNSIGFPLILLDNDLSIRRLNQSASRCLNLPYAVRGQNLGGLGLPPPYDKITNIAGEVLVKGTYKTAELYADHKYYDVEASPCVDNNGDIIGVILSLIDNTDLHGAEKEAQTSRKRMTDVMNYSNFIFSVKDVQGRYLFANSRFEELFGIPAKNIVGKTDQDLLPKEIATAFSRGDLEVMRLGMLIEKEETFTINGVEKHFRTVRFSLGEQQDGIHSICMQAEEITDRINAEEQLRLASKVFHRAGEGITVTDTEGKIITVNEAFCNVTGYESDEVIGKTPSFLKSGKHGAEFYNEMWQTIAREGAWQGEIWNKRKNGEIYPEWLTINSVKDDHERITNYVGIFSDISAIKQSQRRIEYLAAYDELTGLPNRNLFMDRLKHALARMKRDKNPLVVMFIDLDNFKTVNDTMGHECGDQLLKEASKRLLECVREEDTLARLGGDEFTVLCEKADYKKAIPIAERIIDYLSASFSVNGKSVYVTASIGLSAYPVDGQDSQTILKHADTAMYRAKEIGKNQYCVFTNEMRIVSQQRVAMETGLRHSLQDENFSLVYQPIYDIGSGEMKSMEALMRWSMPEVGEVEPDVFISLAEDVGLINEMTQWLLKTVCQQIHDWRKEGYVAIPVSVNISEFDLRKSSFIDHIETYTKEFDIQADDLILEVDERALMDNATQVVENLNRLKTIGFKIDVDDYGTGNSSLSYLKRYNIDALKIDNSFIEKVDQEEDSKAVVKATIEMANALGLRVIAEGVETKSQENALQALHCRLAQGFHYNKPVSGNLIRDLLKKES